MFCAPIELPGSPKARTEAVSVLATVLSTVSVEVMGRISHTVTLSKFTTGTCLVVVCSMGSFSNKLVLCDTSLNSCLIRWSYTGFHLDVHW